MSTASARRLPLLTALGLIASAGAVLLSALPAPAAAAPGGQTCTLRCESDKKITCTSRSGDCQYFVGGLGDVIVCDGNPTTCPLPAP